VIEQLETDLADLRTRQSVPKALITRGIYTPGKTYDITAVVLAAGTSHTYIIYFDGDGSQPNPYGYPVFSIFNGSTALVPWVSDASGAGFVWVTFQNIPHSYGWSLTILNQGAGPITFNGSIGVLESSNGTITVTG
jgi:hypothetical protein